MLQHNMSEKGPTPDFHCHQPWLFLTNQIPASTKHTCKQVRNLYIKVAEGDVRQLMIPTASKAHTYTR